jgi:hypothetical protein
MGDAEGILTSLAMADAAVTRNDHIIAVLLLCLVVFLGVSAFAVRRIVRAELKRKSRFEQGPGYSVTRPSAAALLDAPQQWLAIHTANLHLVQSALEVQNPRSCVWGDVIGPFEPHLFISPPVNGWILVTGSDLPDPVDDVDQCFLFLMRLSQKLGEVQFFVRNRAVSHHGWVKLDTGKVIRGYIWAGETLWNQGAVTGAEGELRLRSLPYEDSKAFLGLSEALATNTERVNRLAGAWSIDPTLIEAGALEAKGISGDLLHSKLH